MKNYYLLIFTVFLSFIYPVNYANSAITTFGALTNTSKPWPNCSSTDKPTNITPKETGPMAYGATVTFTITGINGFQQQTISFTNNVANRNYLAYNTTNSLYCSQSYTTAVIYYSSCPTPGTKPPAYYDADGMTCKDHSYDHLSCGWVPVTMPDAYACCSNKAKDGLEFSMDQGGACTNLAASCPTGGQPITVDGVTFCGVLNIFANEASCTGNTKVWTGSVCYDIAGAPIYSGPENDSLADSTDTLQAANLTNEILKDSINSSNQAAASIVAAINTNSDVTNRSAQSVVSAIANNQSAIVTAINNKTLTVPAPVVNVDGPVVNVDTSSVTNALNSNAATTNAKLDGIKAAIEANGPAGPGGTDTEVKAAVDGLKPGIDGTKAAVDAIKDKINQAPVIAGAPGEYKADIEGETASRFGARFQAFTDALSGAPVFAVFDSVLSGPSGSGGSPSVSVNAGRYGSFDIDFGPFGSALSVFGKLLVAASLLVAARLILANK